MDEFASAFEDLRKRILDARAKHPWRDELDRIGEEDDRATDRKMFLAMTEEVGELATELLEDRDRYRIEQEALDVACVAMRMVMRR